MLEIIGSKGFTITHTGTVYGDDRQQSKYIIENSNPNSNEYLYVNEEQVDELIHLLQKVKEIL